MVIYYHTATNIFAVSNGRCSEVMDREGNPIEASSFIGHELKGGVPALFGTIVPETEIKPGFRLQFDLHGVTITTEPVITAEEAPTLSLRPHPLPKEPSLPPPRARMSTFPDSPDSKTPRE